MMEIVAAIIAILNTFLWIYFAGGCFTFLFVLWTDSKKEPDKRSGALTALLSAFVWPAFWAIFFFIFYVVMKAKEKQDESDDR